MSLPSETEQDIVDGLAKLLLDTMMLAKPPQVPDRFAAIESLQVLHAGLLSLRDSVYAASNGDLSGQISLKGYTGGALKTLLANLRHITWQTRMIASGDFTQRVEFMGEFSQSFNAMVMQLDQTLKEVASKKTELTKANENLLQEITIRKKTEAALRESGESLRLLAITDSLTGLYTGRHFNELAADEISRALRYSRPLSVMMFDIDCFKRINDTYGHPTGDKVLQQVARLTQEAVRDTDTPARYGGEEFIVLLPETCAPEAAAVAERLRNRIAETAFQTEADPIAITVSLGVSDNLEKTNLKPYVKALPELVAYADQALQAAKQAGKNRVTMYEPTAKPR